jgi:pullulanase
VPLQPVAPQKVATRRGRGVFSSLLLLLFLGAVGAFVYAMFRFDETPQQVWERVMAFVQPQPTPAPADPPPVVEPLPTAPPEIVSTPPPQTDPLAWLAQNRNHWPDEVVLREAFEFPVIHDGRMAGRATMPAGTEVKLIQIRGDELVVAFRGGSRRVPVAATDLAVRAQTAIARAEELARQPKPAAVAAAPTLTAEELQRRSTPGREATQQEIATGLGAMYTRHSTMFRVFAPLAQKAAVVLYDEASGDKGRAAQPLKQLPNGLWEARVNGDLRGRYYTYLLEGSPFHGGREVIDPYARNAVANSTRGLITDAPGSVRPGPRVESPVDMIVYEMHVRDFTIAASSGVKEAGMYLGFVEPGTRLPEEEAITTGLDHLVELGVTHVQLMPIHDFENDEAQRGYNWGYMSAGFFSPEGMFATNLEDDSRIRELKALVDGLHARGIGVILDVVYNHTGHSAPFMTIAPRDYYRHWPNGNLANGSGTGNEFRSEAPMGRRVILDSLKYWTREFGFDGYRFDLMALIDQKTMREAERELRAINPAIVLYGEPWMAADSPLRDRTDKGAMRKVEPIGAFNDDYRNALKGVPDGGEPGWIQNGSRAGELKRAMMVSDWFTSPEQSINYMTAHDNLVLWDKLQASMPGAGESLLKETMKLGYLALFTSQGVPFIHGGEEFGRTKFGHHNSYDAGDGVNQVDWTLKRDHHDLFTFVRDVIALRKAHPLFRLRTRQQVQSRVNFVGTPGDHVLMYTIRGDGLPGETWNRACVVLNSANDSSAEVTLPPGEWIVALNQSGAVAQRESVSGKLTLRFKSGAVLYQR